MCPTFQSYISYTPATNVTGSTSSTGSTVSHSSDSTPLPNNNVGCSVSSSTSSEPPAKCWSAKYTLPVFPPQVKSALESKSHLCKATGKTHVRSAMIQVLMDDMSKYTWYPTRKMYTDVLDALCTKYPFLKDGSSSGYETLLDCLRNKFKKERIPLVSDQTVAAAKAKFGSPGRGRKRSGDPPENALHKKHRTCFTTTPENGEDAHSIKNHLTTMSKEMEKLRPNLAVLKDLLVRTSTWWTSDIESKTTSEAVQTYPFLRIPSLIMSAMEIQFGVSVQENLGRNLPIVVDSILKRTGSSNMGKIMGSDISSEMEELRKRGMQKGAALLLLPELFKEKSELLYTLEKDATSPTPTIMLGGTSRSPLTYTSIAVSMDNLEVVKDDKDMDITDAISCLFSGYYIYGVEYPRGLKNTLMYLEKYIFNVPGSSKVPVPVLKVHNILTM